MTENWIIAEGEEGATTVTGTYTFNDEEVCTNGVGSEHPLKPREKQLGASGSSASIHAETSNSSGSYVRDYSSSDPVPIPIDFQPVGSKNYGTSASGGVAIGGLWAFDSPTLAADITATANTFVAAGPPSPPSQSFRIPVTQAKSCGNGFG